MIGDATSTYVIVVTTIDRLRVCKDTSGSWTVAFWQRESDDSHFQRLTA